MKRDGGDKKFGNRTDNSSVTLRVTAPFAQGSHKVGHAPTAITKGSHCRGRVPTVFEQGSHRGKKVLKTERGGALFLFFESLFFSPKKRCFSRETLPCPLRLHFFPKDERTERLSEKGDFLRKAASPHMPPPPHDRMRHDPTREFCRMRCRAYGGTRNGARNGVSDIKKRDNKKTPKGIKNSRPFRLFSLVKSLPRPFCARRAFSPPPRGNRNSRRNPDGTIRILWTDRETDSILPAF